MYICLFVLTLYSLSLYPFQANQSLDDLVPLLEDPCNIQVSRVLYFSHHLLVLHAPIKLDNYLLHSHTHYY